jgi:predicted house-cleaning noncanonical NTP pyrophosphatase (MazG superfamily)
VNKTFLYNKLVRDKSYKMVERSNGTMKSRRLDDAEFAAEVRKKLVEELDEVLTAPNTEELCDELGDVYELLEEYAQLHGLTGEQVAAAKHAKRKKRGGFAERVYIESVTVPAGSIVDEYCSAQPDKYPISSTDCHKNG